MSNNLAKIKKCGNEKCNKVVSPKELENEKKKYVKESGKKCKSKKNPMETVKCIFNVMNKSKFYSLLQKKNQCIKENCGSNTNKNSKKDNNSLRRKKRKSKSKKKKN
jgi:hypothetical protein